MTQEKKQTIHINYPVSLKRDLRDRFKEYCKTHGYAASRRISLLLELDMLGKINIE